MTEYELKLKNTDYHQFWSNTMLLLDLVKRNLKFPCEKFEIWLAGQQYTIICPYSTRLA